jgi:hypothetical protein
MKFTVTMKDPDALYESAKDAAEAYAQSIEGLGDDEREALRELRLEKLTDFASEYMRYGEYIDVEFDTEAGTATVLKDDR